MGLIFTNTEMQEPEANLHPVGTFDAEIEFAVAKVSGKGNAMLSIRLKTDEPSAIFDNLVITPDPYSFPVRRFVQFIRAVGAVDFVEGREVDLELLTELAVELIGYRVTVTVAHKRDQPDKDLQAKVTRYSPITDVEDL